MIESNPFFHRGRPIRDPAYFYGRQYEVSQCLQSIRQGQSVSIIGPSRIGKTSLLLHLSNPEVFGAHDLVPERSCWVYIDCATWSTLQVNDVYAQLMELTCDVLEENPTYRYLASVPPASGPFRAFTQFIRTLMRERIHLVFLLDRFDALSANPHLDEYFFSFMRSLANSRGVVYVTASTVPLVELTYDRVNSLSSPFHNFPVPMHLGLFDSSDVETFLTSLSARANRQFEASTVHALRDLAGSHPLLLQIAAYHAFDVLSATGTTLDAVGHREVRRRFLVEAEPHWSYVWHKLTLDDQYILAMLPVAWQENLSAVQRLERAGLVLRRDSAVDYLSPMFQAFVRQQDVPGLLQTRLITLDPTEQIALLRGHQLAIHPVEFRLLAHLIENCNKAKSHDELESAVWSDVATVPDPERLRTAIRGLRHTLGDAANCIKNVRGFGYKYVDVEH